MGGRRRLLLPLPRVERVGVRGRWRFGIELLCSRGFWRSKLGGPNPLTPTLSPAGRGSAFVSARLSANSLLVAFAIAASISHVHATELLHVGNAGRESFSFTPANIGKETGIFARHGLDLDIAGFGGDAKLQQAMAANAIDIGLGSGPGLAFIAKGAPVKGIAAMAGPPLIFAMVVRGDGSVKTVDDLKGRKVAISTVGSATNWLMNVVSRQHGWGFDGIPQVPIGENSARIAALKSGAVDACIVDIGSALNFVERGDGRILMRFGDVVQHFIMHVIFATDVAIAQKPAALTAFLQGWFETVAFMRANKAKSVAIAMTVMGTDEKITSGIYDELMPMFSNNGRFDPAALKVLSRSFVEMKTLPEAPDLSKLYTEAFLPKS
jgi:ABC-type nitrate/sulfonate/bicarbonate transport system substrate-binding protein